MKPVPCNHHHGLMANPLLLLSRPDTESKDPQRSGPRSVLSGGRRVSRPLPAAKHFGSDSRQSRPIPVRRTTLGKVIALLLHELPICHLGGTQQQQESTDLNYDTNELSMQENREQAGRGRKSGRAGGGGRGWQM